MRGFEVVAIVIGLFFAIGIAVAMLLVVALPLLRPMHSRRRSGRGYPGLAVTLAGTAAAPRGRR